MTTEQSGYWLIDIYAGRIAWQGHWLTLPDDWVALAWQWQPNGYRVYVRRTQLNDPSFSLVSALTGNSLDSDLSVGNRYVRTIPGVVIGPELTVEERRAARVVRFGRVGRAQALRVPECPARIFDDLDNLKELAEL